MGDVLQWHTVDSPMRNFVNIWCLSLECPFCILTCVFSPLAVPQVLATMADLEKEEDVEGGVGWGCSDLCLSPLAVLQVLPTMADLEDSFGA